MKRLCVLLMLVLAVSAGAARGQLTERIVTAADPDQAYALYLPPGYDAERLWPVLVVMDARGRALPAAERFLPAAERLGWVVVSAYGTESDTGLEPNQKALAAVLPDMAARVAEDPNRLYFAGFSGTARIAWMIGEQGQGSVAGIVAASGGTIDSRPPKAAPPFAVAATAGRGDFNHREMLRVAEALDEHGGTYRLEVFDGGHEWCPEPVCARALGFLELAAMRQGRRPADPALIARLLDERLAHARALAEAGDLLAAHEAYSGIARDFEGLIDTEAYQQARREAERLGGEGEVRAARRQREHLGQEEERFGGRLTGVLRSFLGQDLPWPAARLSREIGLSTLLHRARPEAEDRQDADAARRMLAVTYSRLSFYTARELAEEGDHLRLAVVLETALEIHDERPHVWYDYACALARTARPEAALEALETAVDKGFTDLEHLEQDEDLESLRELPGYQRLVGRSRTAAPSPPAHRR